MGEMEKLLYMFPFICASCERSYAGDQRSTYNPELCKGCDMETQKLDNREGLPVCPSCGGYIPNNDTPGAYPGALSRKDNVTEICSECGTREALENKVPADDLEDIIKAISGVVSDQAENIGDVYVDYDSGTILNGPLYALNGIYLSTEKTDDEVRLLARLYGRKVE